MLTFLCLLRIFLCPLSICLSLCFASSYSIFFSVNQCSREVIFFLIPWRPVPFKLFKSNSHQINGRIYYSVSHTLAVLALFYRTRFPLSAIVINFHHPVFKIPHATVSWDITSFSCLLTPFAADSCYGKQQCLNFS